MSVIVTINDDEAEKFADLKQQYDTDMEECRSKNVEAVNALAASLDNVIEVRGLSFAACVCLRSVLVVEAMGRCENKETDMLIHVVAIRDLFLFVLVC